MIIYSEMIKRLRNEKNMTQSELAREINVTRQAVSQWENGQTEVTAERILDLCAALGVTPSEFLGIEEEAGESDEMQRTDDRMEPEDAYYLACPEHMMTAAILLLVAECVPLASIPLAIGNLVYMSKTQQPIYMKAAAIATILTAAAEIVYHAL